MSLWDDPFAPPRRKRQLTYPQRFNLWETGPKVCALCGKRIRKFEDVEFDHVRAYSKGGATKLQNIRMMHHYCNRRKGTRTIRQTRKTWGIKTKEDTIQELLRQLPVTKLKELAKAKGVPVAGSRRRDLFGDYRVAPSKTKFVNALTGKVTTRDIQRAKARKTRPKKKKTRRRNESSFLGFGGW